MKLSPNPKPFFSSLGERGERAACEFLRAKGYDILDKNYQCKIGEIDIIARRKERLVFIEVKTRTSGQFGSPQEAVGLKKQEKIFKLAQWYLKEKKLKEIPIAFDVVAVLWKEDRAPEIRLIMDAFEKADKGY